MISFNTYLNESYSSDMKKLIPSNILKYIGDIFAKYKMSINKAQFTRLNNQEYHDTKKFTYLILVTKSDNVIVFKNHIIYNYVVLVKYKKDNYSDYANILDYEKNNDIKYVWGTTIAYDKNVDTLQTQRKDNKNIIDKLDSTNYKISTQIAYNKLDNIIKEHNLKIITATPKYISFQSTLLDSKFSINYNQEDKEYRFWHQVEFTTSKEIDDYINKLKKHNLKELDNKLKDFDVSKLPTTFN